jgi:hypothetical protein
LGVLTGDGISTTEHVFGDILKRIPALARRAMQSHLREADDEMQAKREAEGGKELSAEAVDQINRDLIAKLTSVMEGVKFNKYHDKAYCFKHKTKCHVHSIRQACVDEDLRSSSIVISYVAEVLHRLDPRGFDFSESEFNDMLVADWKAWHSP